jgi:hypothetical protein
LSESFKEDYIYNKNFVLKTYAQTSTGQHHDECSNEDSNELRGFESKKKQRKLMKKA